MNLFRSTTTPPIARNSMNCSSLRRAFIFIPLALAWFALSPAVRAVSPPPDGSYANGNTAEGSQALSSLTTGSWNTALGYQALFKDRTGNGNTATGFQALNFNTTGYSNTADGVNALFSNVSGFSNTAVGYEAGGGQTASENTAIGAKALFENFTGKQNTAIGVGAAFSNNNGAENTAVGYRALYQNNTGHDNTALGYQAGFNLTMGNNNIDIGNAGVTGESNTIRIGNQGTQTATYVAGISGVTGLPNGVGVVIDTTTGQLGVGTSSARFKDDIKPMDKASEAILALKPVTFHYKREIDPKATAQFGLVADEVEKVNPALITRDADGRPYTVRYEAVNAMLLNEFLKEHRKVEEQGAIIAKQQKQIDALTATMKEQAAQIQKVSAQLELSKPAPQTAVNSQ